MGCNPTVVVCFVFLACAAGHAAADVINHPQYQRESGSTPAVPAMDLPILDDTTAASVEYASDQGMLGTLVTAAYAAADAASHAAEARRAAAASEDAASVDVIYEDPLEQALLELDVMYDTYTSMNELLDELLCEELYDELRQEAAGTVIEAASDVPRPSRRALLQATTPATPATATLTAPVPTTTPPTAPAPATPAPATPAPPATPPAAPSTTVPAPAAPTATPAPTTPTPVPTPAATPVAPPPTAAPAPAATITPTPATPSATTTTSTTAATPSSPASTAITDTTSTTTGTAADLTTNSPTTATTTTATQAPVSSPVVPAKATTVQPDETVPVAVQQEVATTNSQSNQSFVLPSTEVTVSFVVLGIKATDFESNYRQTVLNTVASTSGTTADQWQSGTSEQSTSGRRLRQATDLKVDLKILTVNPNLVVYRLAKAPANAVTGCSSDVCAVLADAGVPIDKNSFLLGPATIYNNLFGIADSGTTANSDAAALQQRRDLGKIVGSSVAGGVVLILLLLNYKRFIGCYRSSRAASAHKKQLKQQQKVNGPALAGSTIPHKSALAPSKDVSSRNVMGDPIVKYATAERMQVLRSGSGVSDGSSSRISASGMHATPRANGLPPQREVVEEVESEQVPEVHYYQSQDLDEEVKDRAAFYLQRGNTLDDIESADQGSMRHPTAAAVPVYHTDSDSFKIWADQSAAAAVAAAGAPTGRRTPQRHTPASSSIVDMASLLPGSPIGSPLHSNPNSYGDLTNPRAHYPQIDPIAIQQTLTQLQNLMQQQQHMMTMMGGVAPASNEHQSQHPAYYDRMSTPGFQQAYGARPGFARQPSPSAPGTLSGSPRFSSPASTPVSAGGGLERSGSFAPRGVESNGVGRLSKMDGSNSGASGRRIRAESQHGHQDMLATPFASPALGPFNFRK